MSSTDSTLLLEKNEPTEKEDYPIFGQVLGLLSAVGYVASATFVQLLNGKIPDFELNCFRFGVPIPILFIWGYHRNTKFIQPAIEMMLLFFFGAALCSNSLAYFGAMVYIAVGSAECLAVSFTIIITTLLSFLCLKETIGKIKLLAIIVALIGILGITQPEFIFNFNARQNKTKPDWRSAVNDSFNTVTTDSHLVSHTYNKFSNSAVTLELGTLQDNNATYPKNSAKTYLGYTLIFVYGLCQATSVLLIRGTRLGNLGLDVQLTTMHCFGLILSLPPMFIFETPSIPKDITSVSYLVCHTILSFLSALAYNLAVNLTSGVLVTQSYTTAVVFAMLSQYFVLQKIRPGHRNLYEILGSVLVIIAASLNPIHTILTEKFRSKSKEKQYDILEMQ